MKIITEDEARKHLADEVAKQGTQKAFADANGISPAYLSDVLSKRRDLGDRVLASIGLERVVTYRKKSNV